MRGNGFGTCIVVKLVDIIFMVYKSGAYVVKWNEKIRFIIRQCVNFAFPLLYPIAKYIHTHTHTSKIIDPIFR